MDTKWKKSKKAAGFIAWYMGIALLGISLFWLMLEGSGYRSLGQQVREVFDGDYRNTEDFRYYMEDYLNTFLSMSVDGPVYSSVNYSGGYFGLADYYGYGTAETAVEYVEETVDSDATLAAELGYGSVAEAAVTEDSAYEREYPNEKAIRNFSFSSSPSDTEQNKKEAQAYHESIKNDRNILYTIAGGGEVKYTNDESLGMYGDDFIMPAGYGFLIYFDGSKVTVMKDGKELDLYGDGYYRDDMDWNVPGYYNFRTDDAIKESRVCIVAADVPSMFVAKDYGGGSSYYNSGFYEMQQSLALRKEAYVRWIYDTVFAVILLGIGIVLRKSRKEMKIVIGSYTGRVWFECKLLLFLCAVFAVFMGLIALLYELSWYGYSFLREYREAAMDGGFRWVSGIVYLIVLLCLSILWLFINDIRCNKKVWRNGLCGRIAVTVNTRMLKLPVSKRLVRNQAAVLLSELAAGFILSVLVGIWGGYTGAEEEALVLEAGLAVCFILLAALQLKQVKGCRRMGRGMDAILERIGTIKEGSLTEPASEPEDMDPCFAASMAELNEIRSGMDIAINEQMKSERMKVELIANVSHDIKTPLTSIISYVELLKQEDNLPEHVKEYVSILEGKSQRLKAMVQDVFEVSKAASGELPVHMEKLDLGKLLRQTIADMSEQIEAGNVSLKPEIAKEAITIYADGDRLYRVFQNLIQNALKYSLEGSRIYVTLKEDGMLAVASVKNTSKEELAAQIDFTERFTRGDKSRSDGGSGLGLSIARSFTEACGGSFQVETIADLFVVTIGFPLQ